MIRKTSTVLGCTVGAAAVCLSGIAAAQLPGAIFTTDADGAIVNGNVMYESKCGLTGVWLNGGPGPNAPQHAAGLPDGDYFYQVTDPSGKDLLSLDPVEDRCVVVSGGVITGNCPTGDHHTRPSVDSPASGDYVVELCDSDGPDDHIPFEDTKNNGGVYKAWMTPTDMFDGDPAASDPEDNECGPQHGCFFGFVERYSKTDNFKVKDIETYCITAWKFLVTKKKGIFPVPGWPIEFSNGVLHTADTGQEGWVEHCGLTAGEYSVAEWLGNEYIVVATEVNGEPISPPTASVTVSVGKGKPENRNPIVVFYNTPKDDNNECTKDCYYK